MAVRETLVERVAATRVYGAPPQASVPVVVEPDPEYIPMFAAGPEPVLIPRRRRRDLVVGGVLALVLVLGGIWAYTYYRDRPVRDALDRSSATYAALLDALAAADDLASVREVGETAQQAASDLAATEARIAGHDNDLGRAAGALVRSQAQVALAAAQLTGLTRNELGLWGIAERDLDAARSALTQARADLAEVDQDEAAPVDDPARAIDNVRTIVGRSASQVLTTSVDDLVSRLAEVDTTAQVRGIAKEAENDAAVVRAALSGLSGDSATAVQAAGGVLDILTVLRALDTDHLGVWGDNRTALVDALGSLSLDGFRVRANAAVDRIDALVTNARATLRQWREDLARAKRKQDRARTTLASYGDAVREQLTAYQGLRAELSAFFAQVEAPDEEAEQQDPTAVLLGALEARRDILRSLEDLVAPTPLNEAHAALEDVVRHAVRAVRRAHEGLAESYYCEGCVYADSASYLAFSADSTAITGEYAAAESSWQGAVAEVRESISDKALPEKPTI